MSTADMWHYLPKTIRKGSFLICFFGDVKCRLKVLLAQGHFFKSFKLNFFSSLTSKKKKKKIIFLEASKYAVNIVWND